MKFNNLLIILILTVSNISTYAQDCKSLESGTYKVIVTTKNYDDFLITLDIDNGIYRMIINDTLTTDSLTWNNCNLIIHNTNQNLNPTNDQIVKALEQLGDLVYEFNPKDDKLTFRLTHTGNRKITIYEGRFIKMELRK